MRDKYWAGSLGGSYILGRSIYFIDVIRIDEGRKGENFIYVFNIIYTSKVSLKDVDEGSEVN